MLNDFHLCLQTVQNHPKLRCCRDEIGLNTDLGLPLSDRRPHSFFQLCKIAVPEQPFAIRVLQIVQLGQAGHRNHFNLIRRDFQRVANLLAVALQNGLVFCVQILFGQREHHAAALGVAAFQESNLRCRQRRDSVRNKQQKISLRKEAVRNLRVHGVHAADTGGIDKHNTVLEQCVRQPGVDLQNILVITRIVCLRGVFCNLAATDDLRAHAVGRLFICKHNFDPLSLAILQDGDRIGTHVLIHGADGINFIQESIEQGGFTAFDFAAYQNDKLFVTHRLLVSRDLFCRGVIAKRCCQLLHFIHAG